MDNVISKQSSNVLTKAKHSLSSTEDEKSSISCTETLAEFQVLASPIHSQSDKKEYKVIRLKNGLTACLISDMADVTDLNSILSTNSDSESDECESDDGTSSNAESAVSNSEEEGEDDEHKIHRVHDEVKLAAAALCIGVGSFSDPKEVPGLAHFLEHMVFMGSEKFPQENDFDAFIKKHGGSDNASTDYEQTTFYFECFEKHLDQALDKFAQFFISPLMKRDSLTREREAVESEFQMAVPSDDHRKEQMLVGFAEQSSPVHSFSWGNLVTLKDNISEDKLYEALHDFRKQHYSAHRMTLAVQARLPIDLLESYVINHFSAIPNNGLSPIDFSGFSERIFDTPQFNRLYYIKPVKDVCQIDLTWVMPPLLNKYKSKPHVYVSWLLGHEGKGSLLAYLRKKVWALSLYAGNGESGMEYNSIYASFSVNIVLTESGFDHLSEVILAVFSYIKLLKNVGPDENIFKEMQSIAEMSFRFEDDETASDNVEDLAEFMHFYPPEDYLTGSELFFEYKPDEIMKVLDHLVPNKMNIMVSSFNTPPGISYDKVEQWFKTQYMDKEIPHEWMESWLIAEPLPDFFMPEPNPFLTKDFSLLSVENDIPEYPEKILYTPLVELWYRKDQKFKLPTAYYYYYLITPYSLESAKSACMIQMFVALVTVNLSEEGYSACLAELDYSIVPCEKGICLKISGYSEKLPILVDLVAKHLKNVPDNLSQEMFEALRNKQKRGFYNTILKPSKLCKDLRLYILQNKYYSLLDRYSSTMDITFEEINQFSKDVLKHLYVQGLVQGNVTSTTALETTYSLLKQLGCEPLSPNSHPELLSNEIPKGEHCCRVQSFNENNANSIITNYYQCGLLTIKDNVILELIILLIEEPLFDILRTKEQLGYNVYCTIRNTNGILGYSITVNTQADKYTVRHVDSRIEAFIKHTHKLLKCLNDKSLNQTKKDLIKMKRCVDVDLEDEMDRNWEEIVTQKYSFNRLELEIAAIESLKSGEIKKWWSSHNVQNKNGDFRKLTVQIVGHPSKLVEEDKEVRLEVDVVDNKLKVTKPTQNEIAHMERVNVIRLEESTNKLKVEAASKSLQLQEDSIKELSLQFLEDSNEVTNQNRLNNYFIMNVEDFKKQLKVYSKS